MSAPAPGPSDERSRGAARDAAREAARLERALDRRRHTAGNRLRRWLLGTLARLHDWAEAGWAPHAVATWGALQGSVVPGPSEALLVPLGVADPPKVGRLALAALAGAFAGGLVAYAIGTFAFDEIGRPILHLMGIADTTIAASEGLFDRRGWMIVLLSTVSPLPTKLVCMAAGAFGVPFLPFSLALLAGRGARFLAIALLVRLAGERVERWAGRYVRKRGNEGTGEWGSGQ